MSQVTEMWHQLSAQQTAEKLGVDVQRGLSAAEAQQRQQQYGANRLAGKKKETGWQAFLRQYQDFMQLVLLGAALINQLVTHEWGTTIVLAGLTVFNAIMGMNQEAKAEASLAALEQMLKTIARVRRDGQPVEVDAEQLVPGDIVLMEAGNVVPADGRLFVAATLEIEEAALTGESVPTLKDAAATIAAEAPLGDRIDMAYMNTSVTRGRAEMIVTATGMNTEIGHIADMLNKTEADKTPLQKQLDQLSKVIAAIGGVALILVVALGLVRGQPFDQLFITGVALAVAAIPTGLPAVVTTLLSMGTREVAKRNAIVKRLPAVETLGSTSAICSDKTGTLTLNKMTARELIVPGQNRYRVTGEGYSTHGQLELTRGIPAGQPWQKGAAPYGTEGQLLSGGGAKIDLDPFLLPMILCSDAVLDGEALIGDPTEGALIVLAAKGGLDIAETRQTYPRVAEIPFDSEYKFMATFHRMTTAQGQPVVRCYVKGAPDVLIGRSSAYWSPDDGSHAITDNNRRLALDENDRLAGGGMRVMVVAERDFDPATFNPQANLIDEMHDLTLMAMVGIVDPPRPEARAAIAEAKSAGIRVRMITGDHATTAAAIGRELGLDGRAVTGAEFAAMSDEELKTQLPSISVIARVAPEDKVRLVSLLQENGEIVAMTGDGVNDAPALKKANIGVAMGITGTEVSKQAAVMILTDDNFATIVNAVEYGRALYDNLLKYLRFQMATLVAYIATFVGAGIFGIANGVPLGPLAILWLNFAIDIPLAIALGFDRPTPGLMARKPRPLSAPVFTTMQWVRLTVQGLLMTVGVLLIYQWAEPRSGAVVASTLLMTTLSLFHVIMGLCARDQRASVFRLAGLPGAHQLRLFGLALLLTVLATELGIMQRILDTTSLNLDQWLVAIGVALCLLVIEEVVKFFLRRPARQAQAVAPAGEVAPAPTAA